MGVASSRDVGGGVPVQTGKPSVLEGQPTRECVYIELVAIEAVHPATAYGSTVHWLNVHLRLAGLSVTETVSSAFSRLGDRFRCEEERRLTAAALSAFAAQLEGAPPAPRLRGFDDHLNLQRMQRVAPRMAEVIRAEWGWEA
jgi:hypothetical protein